MDYADRQFIMSQLQDGQKPDSIAHALLMRRALQEVGMVARDMEQAEARQRWTVENQYYVLLGPKPAPVKIKEEDGQELWQQPGRQEYRVRVVNFPAFCGEMGLPLARMQELLQGQHHDVQDWQCVWTGGSMDVGRAWVDPMPQLRAEEARQAVAKTEPRRTLSVYSPSAPMIEWTPAE